MAAAVLAAALAVLGHLLGWQGVDTAAQAYRVDAFRHAGFTLWDFQWYGGHWTLDYSLLYPPLAATLGMLTVTVLSAAVAAWAFDRLARRHLGSAGPAASYVFAAGTLVAASIGQLTSLAGEAFGLLALLALSRGRHGRAMLLGLACTLTSPLTGAFLALAAVAWAVDGGLSRHRQTVVAGGALAAVAGLPIVLAAALFPGDGPMPYPAADWAWEMVVAAAVGALAGRRHRVVALGAALFMVAATVSEVVPSALGGNVGRIEDMVALPLAVGLAWSRLPVLVPVAAVPLALSQWSPAWGAFTTASSQPSTHASFYASLERVLRQDAASGPAARVEVVPTEYHWEAAYVPSVMPMARGWERQLDEADNPIFYVPGRLTASAYRSWLLDNGVRYVALPSAPLDMAAREEGNLISSGRVPGLRLIWRSPEWRLFEVSGATGIVSGPAQLVRADGSRVVLDASRPGPVTVRVRWSPAWYVSDGAGCVVRDRSWLSVDVRRAGQVTLAISPLRTTSTGCPQPVAGSVPTARPGA
ncbi:MAG TPA: hypothetical protein VFH58_17315 [Acidimicrobiales bacterium]|nr:hypothetical protein [Acidimicrobiales bacterium]